MLAGTVTHRALIWQLTKREVTSRYRTSFLGLLWAVLTPLGMLVLYGFVFGVVMGVRWQSPSSTGGGEFLGPMFAGMIVFLFVAECVSRAPGLVVSQADLLKKVAFPPEVLCAAAVAAALIQAAVSIVLLWLWLILTARPVGWHFLAFILAWIPLVLFTLGATYLLAALGVFVRDISQLTGPLNSVLLLLSPVMYPLSAVPEPFRYLVATNPLTPFIEATRTAAIFNETPGTATVLLMLGLGACTFFVGSYFFSRSKRAFVDVL